MRGLGARHGEAHHLGRGDQLCTSSAQRTSSSWLAPRWVPARHLLLDGLDHGGMAVAEEQGAVPHPVVDVLVAVHVPLVGALGALHVDRERGQVPAVVGDAARDHAAARARRAPRTSDAWRDRCRARRMAWLVWVIEIFLPWSGQVDRGRRDFGAPANSLSSSSMPTWAAKGKPSTVGSAPAREAVHGARVDAGLRPSALLLGRVQEGAAGRARQLGHDAVGAPVRGARDDQVAHLHHRGDAARQRAGADEARRARCPCRSRCRRRPRRRW